MRRHAKPWTLGEVLSGGIGGFVHWFAPGGPCYGCVASHLQRTVVVDNSPPPDYANPGGAVPETTIPASMASIHAIASLHALVTLALLGEPSRLRPRLHESVARPAAGAGRFRGGVSALPLPRAARGGLLDLPTARPRRPRWRISMWPWIKRWRDWAMNDLWPLYRISPQPQALHYSYEKAGLTLHDQPIPWNAEAVLVEALLRLPPSASRRKGDFLLRLPGQPPIAAEQLRRQEADDRYAILFRLPPPTATVRAEILYRNHVLGQLTLPFLSREEFLQNLRLQLPTLFVRLGSDNVACQTFVASQCRGLLANAVLLSPTSLAPLLDLDLAVEFRCERGGAAHRTPARLCSSQLAGRQALVAVMPRRHPRRIGAWTATWLLGDRPLATQRLRAISQNHFHRSLRLSDTRFVVQRARRAGAAGPPGAAAGRVGTAGTVLPGQQLRAGHGRPVPGCAWPPRSPGAVQPPLLQEQEVLITDGPTMVAPGTLDAADLAQVSGFELSVRGRTLGVLSLCPAPTAAFTSEGGFKPPHDFTWTAAAEEEMTERLNRLLEGKGKGE